MRVLVLLHIPLYACSATSPVTAPCYDSDHRPIDCACAVTECRDAAPVGQDDGPSEVNTWDTSAEGATCTTADGQCAGGLCYGWQCCTGCFDGQACQVGNADGACGAAGQNCNVCDPGKACVGGACQ